MTKLLDKDVMRLAQNKADLSREVRALRKSNKALIAERDEMKKDLLEISKLTFRFLHDQSDSSSTGRVISINQIASKYK